MPSPAEQTSVTITATFLARMRSPLALSSWGTLPMVQEFCHRVLILDDGHVVAEGAPDAIVQPYSELMSLTAEMTV